jgi:hypothetical protein
VYLLSSGPAIFQKKRSNPTLYPTMRSDAGGNAMTRTRDCPRCKRQRDWDEFYGLDRVCRLCKRERKYDLAPGEFERMLEEQGGECAICGSPGQNARGLELDHNHYTGKNRGLLCGVCNRAIYVFDDRWFLPRVLAYLQKYDPEHPAVQGCFMPSFQDQSSLQAKYGERLRQAILAHRNDETVVPGGNSSE